MKRIFKVSVSAALIAFCFFGCSNIPDEPATTGTEHRTYINELGETVPIAENIDDYPGITQPPKHIATTHDVELVLRSYYIFGNTVVTFDGVELENIDVPQSLVYGTVNARIMGKGKEKEMKIAYRAYDENGNLLKKNGCMTADIDGMDNDSTFDFLFAVPLGTAKIEFYDYK